MNLTWLDNNSWLWEINTKRILVDPWLVGRLVFLNSPWFFEGENPQPQPIPEQIDLILLSQGLPDHAHPETLKQLDRRIPVICSPNAARVVKGLGYEQVTELPHNNVYTFEDAVEIRAVRGSELGPFLTENGYVLKDLTTGLTLYYEPHGFHDASLDAFAPIDVVITPVVDMMVPVAGAILQGYKTGLDLAKRLTPQIMVPTAGGGDVQYQGILATVLHCRGGAAEMQQRLADANLPTQVLPLRPGDRTSISVTPYRSSVTAHNI